MIRLVADENIAGLELLPQDSIEVVRRPGREIDRECLRDADVLWTRSVTRVDAALLEHTAVRFVGTATAGREHVDEGYLRDRGIAFAAAPGANANAVVEYVLAALACLRTPWDRLTDGGTLAVVGMGSVGRRLTAVAEHLGWSVRCCDPYLGREPNGRPLLPFAELLDCDVISLHCSLTLGEWPSLHLVDGSVLASLRSHQTLINAARGAVVEEAALARRLDAVDPPTVVLDVWEHEPDFDATLLQKPSLKLATPHIAGYSLPAKLNATRMLCEALQEQGLLARPIDFAAAVLPVSLACGADSSAAELLAAVCDVAGDDRRLRVLGRLGEEQRRRGFDDLRRNYRQRPELRYAGFTPDSLHRADARALLQALVAGDSTPQYRGAGATPG